MAPVFPLAPVPPPAQLDRRADLQFLNATTFKCDGPCEPLFIKTCVIIAGLWLYAGIMYLLVEYGLKYESKRENIKRKMGCRRCHCCFVVPIPIRAFFVALLPPLWSCLWTTDIPQDKAKVADLSRTTQPKNSPRSPPSSKKSPEASEKSQRWFQQETQLPKLPPTPSPRSVHGQTPSPPPAYQSPGRLSPAPNLPEYLSPVPPRQERSPGRRPGRVTPSPSTRPKMTFRGGSAESVRSNQTFSTTPQRSSPSSSDNAPVMIMHGVGLEISEERRRRRDEIEQGIERRASVDSLGLYVDLDGGYADRRGKDIGTEGREFI